MGSIINKFFQLMRYLKTTYQEIQDTLKYRPTYRLMEIIEIEEGEFNVKVVCISNNESIVTKPEAILADDIFVDKFSPGDIRTLTYLGYLGVNLPRYKILAKRLAENQDKLVFAVKKRGDDNVVIKTASEIISEKEILSNLPAKDAQMLGYTIAQESLVSEEKLKANAINNAD